MSPSVSRWRWSAHPAIFIFARPSYFGRPRPTRRDDHRSLRDLPGRARSDFGSAPAARAGDLLPLHRQSAHPRPTLLLLTLRPGPEARDSVTILSRAGRPATGGHPGRLGASHGSMKNVPMVCHETRLQAFGSPDWKWSEEAKSLKHVPPLAPTPHGDQCLERCRRRASRWAASDMSGGLSLWAGAPTLRQRPSDDGPALRSAAGLGSSGPRCRPEMPARWRSPTRLALSLWGSFTRRHDLGSVGPGPPPPPTAIGEWRRREPPGRRSGRA